MYPLTDKTEFVEIFLSHTTRTTTKKIHLNHDAYMENRKNTYQQRLENTKAKTLSKNTKHRNCSLITKSSRSRRPTTTNKGIQQPTGLMIPTALATHHTHTHSPPHHPTYVRIYKHADGLSAGPTLKVYFRPFRCSFFTGKTLTNLETKRNGAARSR